MFKLVRKRRKRVSAFMSLIQFATSRYRQICANSGVRLKALTLSRLIGGDNLSSYRWRGFPNKQNGESWRKM